jgi:hypothetical protein
MAQRAVRDVRAWRAGLVAELALPRAEPTKVWMKVVVPCHMVDRPTAKARSSSASMRSARSYSLAGEWKLLPPQTASPACTANAPPPTANRASSCSMAE